MKAESQRIDHLGIIAGIIKEIKLIELIDDRISMKDDEKISTGEAVAGMILNGLGFSNRPMTLTPQFFENKALEKLFREGVKAEYFNRFKLGRALDNCYNYGTGELFAEVSAAVCIQESVDQRFNSLDTSALALSGEYNCETDENAILITHGYSKDHRPDLKQAMIEMMVSQDGGVPLIFEALDGNSSDTKVFKERAIALMDNFKQSETPRYLIADCKLYTHETVQSALCSIGFITRIPASISLEGKTINKAVNKPFEEWVMIDEENHYCSFDIEHYDCKQRWLVISSDQMKERTEKSINKAKEREIKKLQGELKKIGREKFSCKNDAKRSLRKISKAAKYHRVKESEITERREYIKNGRPTQNSEYTIAYLISGIIEEDKEVILEELTQKSCYVLGTNIPEKELTNLEVIDAYKGQNRSVERGFRFLKDPIFFTSSLFIKKPERIEGLLMVMTLALLVYSIAERMLRKYLSSENITLPNQIKKETSTPTLRWIFQMMEGVDLLLIEINNMTYQTISTLTDLKKRIIVCFPLPVQKIYGLVS
jgi:transposase